MRTLFNRVHILLQYLVFGTTIALCQTTTEQKEYFEYQVLFTHENDFLGIGNQDDNYTGGAHLEVLVSDFGFRQPFYEFKGGKNFQFLGIGGTAYTPQDLNATSVVIGDRPYASLTYFGFGRISISDDFQQQVNSQLIIGLTGWQGPGEAQYYIHDNGWFGTTRPNPQGWDNQIGHNGSLVINYNMQYIKNIQFNYQKEPMTQLLRSSLLLGADVGNYMINLKAGFYFNLLNINTFPIFGGNNIGIPALLEENSEVSNKRGKIIRFHVFAEPKVRIVGYDATIQGLLFGDDSAYKIESGDINRLVFDFKAGFKLLILDKFYLGYNHFLRSKEFEDGKSIHYWGGITLGYTPLKKVLKR